jgi:peptidoglycan/LPS O-acetylase OafA/YrhL
MRSWQEKSQPQLREFSKVNKFLPYIHNLRGLAILLIVGVHARGYNEDWSLHPGTQHFFNTLFDNGTVLFVFIAGFLFQHLTHDKFVFNKYFSQKLRVVILPYLLISFPLIFIRLRSGVEALPLPQYFESYSSSHKIFYFIITGLHMPPFWFIPMVFLIYLTSPLLHVLDTRRFYKVAVPFIALIGMFTYRPLNNANPLLSYVHFLPIYITGMWASFNKEKILMYGRKLLAPLISLYLLITILDLTNNLNLDRRLSFEYVLQNHLLMFNIYVLKAVALCFILMIIFQQLHHKNLPLLKMLGDYSFGIYFIHHIFISVARKLVNVYGIEINFNAGLFLIFYLAVVALSVFTVWLMKKITGKYSRYVIGS